MRFAFLEDGGPLANLTFTTPAVLESAVRAVRFTALESFALAEPRSAAGAAHRDEMRQRAEDVREEAPQATFVLDDEHGDAASLAPGHPIDANLRDAGEGFVPNDSARSDEERRATVAVAALEAELDVPYGWHVIRTSETGSAPGR